jgi:hypothetical protein
MPLSLILLFLYEYSDAWQELGGDTDRGCQVDLCYSAYSVLLFLCFGQGIKLKGTSVNLKRGLYASFICFLVSICSIECACDAWYGIIFLMNQWECDLDYSHLNDSEYVINLQFYIQNMFYIAYEIYEILIGREWL